MRKNILKHFFTRYGILFISIIFIVIIKIPHLALPYSWDEAWSYLPALIEMIEKGPNLITGSINLYSSKGHPLFFYFLTSMWVKLFSGNMGDIEIARIFQLLISIALVISLFFIAKKHISQKVANFSVLIISVQSLFLAQASLILPEVLLSLLLLLSFHFFHLKKYIWYAIIASLMILTKETGLVFVGGFGLFYIIENRKKIKKKHFAVNLVFLSIPLFVFGAHLLLNYKAYNTFFFTEHLDYISFDPIKIIRVLKSSTGILLTRYGRNIISVITILSILLILLRKEKIENGKILLLLVFQIVILTFFSSVNFYTYRYMLPAFPLFILFCTIIFEQAVKFKKWIQYPFLILMIAVPLFFTITKKGKTDIDFGYSSYLPLHKEMVVFCENQNWFDKDFAAEFNMVLALRDPFTGYHISDSGFKTKHLPELENIDIVILDSTGEWKQLPENQMKNFKLIKRFENKNDWGEIYMRK